MATVNFRGSWLSKGVHQTLWPTMGGTDVGLPQTPAALSDKTVQIGGTFGGATVVLEGSNDGSTYATLKDPSGTTISVTAAALRQVLENPKYIRPSCSGGVGSSINVTLIERGGF